MIKKDVGGLVGGNLTKLAIIAFLEISFYCENIFDSNSFVSILELCIIFGNTFSIMFVPFYRVIIRIPIMDPTIHSYSIFGFNHKNGFLNIEMPILMCRSII